MTTDPWGVTDGYEDVLGRWHETSPATRSAVLAAMGVVSGTGGPPDQPAVHVVRPGRLPRVPGPAEVILEDGGVLRVDTTLPPDLPLGYHDLRLLGGERRVRLIVSPGRCYLPERLSAWGWAAQLYAVRSATSWGIGDLADLRRLARWATREQGAGFVLVNPVCAAMPLLPQQASPYSPSSRRYRSLLYLRIEEIPGAPELGPDLDRLAAAGRALNLDRRIDRDAVFRLKMEALDRLWSRFAGHPAFDRYVADQAEGLRAFATFCALAEHHRAGWRTWPSEYRHPGSPGVGRFAAEHADRVQFHQWVQWLLDEQLTRAAAEGARVLQDLPIGVDPGGADAWAWQDMLATDVTVGAPPDDYIALGQDWGFPPFVPHKLRAAAYGPFVQTIRSSLLQGGGLRIDHVMGLFRLFWIPKGARPADGAFVRYPADDLLDIVALESHRAGAVVVGEDLGTVEADVSTRLAGHRLLSCRVVWFEAEPPARYPVLSLAAVTTHDLPTIAGLWSGADLKVQHEVGLQPNEEGTRKVRARLGAMTGLRADADVDEVILATHRLLADAPSMMVTATLEDALAVEDRPNIPTTGTERPNWALALPVALEQLESHPRALAIGRILAARRGRADSGSSSPA